MNIQHVLDQLDALFFGQKIDDVEPYLMEQLSVATKEGDYGSAITIMNELIGFFRDTSQYDKSLYYSNQVLTLMKELGYEGTLPYATTVLNVANALRAAGHHQESLELYESILPVYQKELEPCDERIAALYNNMSLLYQEMGDFQQAVICLQKALSIVEHINDEIKIAITHSNLGASYLQLDEVETAMEHLSQAMHIFQKTEEKDFHYNAALAAMGQAYVKSNRWEDARECYAEALLEQMKHCGKSEAFYRILQNLHMVEEKLGIPLTKEPDVVNARFTGLELSEQYYRQIAEKALLEAFPELAGRLAVGLVGEGSDCLGFDDKFSEDHDFGPGFCIWVSREDYDLYGNALSDFYESLPKTFMGYARNTVNGQDRIGVFCIDDFFRKYCGFSSASELSEHVLRISDEKFSILFNGRIFYDPSSLFLTRRKEFLDVFTDKIWQWKIAAACIELGKYGQYNYPRSMKRGDYVTAQMILYKYIEVLLKLVHYVNHTFPPYYKWLKKSASKQEKLAVLADLTDALADFADGREAWKKDPTGAGDKIVGTIEIIAGIIIDECRKEGIFDDLPLPLEERFLEAYGKALYQKLNQDENGFEDLVDYIVTLEWQAFDKVQNVGGRADCQDDWNTFSIMRKSQYKTWPKELLLSFINDFRNANQEGRNLITEKYGRMMISTDPAGYLEIQDKLPSLTLDQQNIIEQIVKVQVTWMEEFAAKYPYMAGNSRSIHTSEDSLYNTSYETYLRGELGTYSHETLKQYGNFIVRLAKSGKNLAEMTMENTARLYGYESVMDAEQNLKKFHNILS